jgi:hypothetical protein
VVARLNAPAYVTAVAHLWAEAASSMWHGSSHRGVAAFVTIMLKSN